MCGKKTETIKVHMSEELFLMLTRLAEAEDRSLSDLCERALRFHAFGHAASLAQRDEKP